MDGAAWYENCLRGLHSTQNEIKEWPIEKRLGFRACRIEAIKVFCEQGWDGDSNKVAENLQAQGWKKEQVADFFCEKVCNPTGWNTPFGGPYVFVVQELERSGGPTFFERWLPAAPMLARVFRARFPQCTTQRKSIGLVGDNKHCLEAELKYLDETPYGLNQ